MKGLGPESIIFGTDEENGAYLNDCQSKWLDMRAELMQYANHHPSDRVREIAHELEHAVMLDLRLRGAIPRRELRSAVRSQTRK